MTELEKIQQDLAGLKPAIVAGFHISSIGVFGAITRDNYVHSDSIDIIVETTKNNPVELAALLEYLEENLGKTVNLISKTEIKPEYFREIEAGIVYI